MYVPLSPPLSLSLLVPATKTDPHIYLSVPIPYTCPCVYGYVPVYYCTLGWWRMHLSLLPMLVSQCVLLYCIIRYLHLYLCMLGFSVMAVCIC